MNCTICNEPIFSTGGCQNYECRRLLDSKSSNYPVHDDMTNWYIGVEVKLKDFEDRIKTLENTITNLPVDVNNDK